MGSSLKKHYFGDEIKASEKNKVLMYHDDDKVFGRIYELLWIGKHPIPNNSHPTRR